MAASDRRSGDGVDVAVSPVHGDPVAAAADAAREGRAGTKVDCRTTATAAGVEDLATGEADVLVASRPLLPAERARATEQGVAWERRELPTAVGTLTHPESVWLESLSPASLAASWRREDAVETWAEATPATDSESDATSDRPDVHASPRGDAVLVRGVRAHQYARGQGGLGYYEPDPDWLVAGSVPDGDAQTPLVRLASLYVDRDARDRDSVAAFVGALARESTDRVGDVRYAASPFEGA